MQRKEVTMHLSSPLCTRQARLSEFINIEIGLRPSKQLTQF